MRLVHGIGVNDADYVVQPSVNGKTIWCPFYQRWKCILQRCYSAIRQETHPAYKNVYVADEWHFLVILKNGWLPKTGKEITLIRTY